MRQNASVVGESEEMGISRVIASLCGYLFFFFSCTCGRIWMKNGIWGFTQQLREVTGSVTVVSETGQQSYWHKDMKKASCFMPGIREAVLILGSSCRV